MAAKTGLARIWTAIEDIAEFDCKVVFFKQNNNQGGKDMAVRHIAFVPASGVFKKIRFLESNYRSFSVGESFIFLGLPGVKVKYTGELNMETLLRKLRKP